ncbi:MAG: hypothetical protein PHC66_01905 [Candidatus Nanoarchaeia archaeon]|nr:hypothetical protein [Candidatus Nanoarchaeia archaeon]MDD5239042.1 hypothetical protein [Candidatus Nanoarchaeia archaeon]
METAPEAQGFEAYRKQFREWVKSPELESLLDSVGKNCKAKGLIRDSACVIDDKNNYVLITHFDKTLVCLVLVETYESGLTARSYYQDFDEPSQKQRIIEGKVERTPESVSEFFKKVLEHYRQKKGYDWSFLIQ